MVLPLAKAMFTLFKPWLREFRITEWAVRQKPEAKATAEAAPGVFGLGCSEGRLRRQKFALHAGKISERKDF